MPALGWSAFGEIASCAIIPPLLLGQVYFVAFAVAAAAPALLPLSSAFPSATASSAVQANLSKIPCR